MRTTVVTLACPALLALLVLALGGCSSENAAPADPTVNALKNPMDYDPMAHQDMDVGGGGLLDYDKAGMKSDVDDVLNP